MKNDDYHHEFPLMQGRNQGGRGGRTLCKKLGPIVKVDCFLTCNLLIVKFSQLVENVRNKFCH